MAKHYPIAHPVVYPVEHHITQYVPHYATCHTSVVATGKGGDAHQQGMFFQPAGVAISPNGRFVCLSRTMNYGLQIFY